MLRSLLLATLFASSALAQSNSNVITLNCKFLEGALKSGQEMIKTAERDEIIKIDLTKRLCQFSPCNITADEFVWTTVLEQNKGSAENNINRHTGFYKRYYTQDPVWLNYQCSPSRPKF